MSCSRRWLTCSGRPRRSTTPTHLPRFARNCRAKAAAGNQGRYLWNHVFARGIDRRAEADTLMRLLRPQSAKAERKAIALEKELAKLRQQQVRGSRCNGGPSRKMRVGPQQGTEVQMPVSLLAVPAAHPPPSIACCAGRSWGATAAAGAPDTAHPAAPVAGLSVG